ncbi:NAD(P)-dependent oxidoreductase [Pararobbsia silviterrae]|uniref:NAD(P)-dependent oxidoreductase n=1 Tax=Pararobbsia silviterrae TaxID=1792498 RepID=UPI0030B7FE65
MAQRPRRGRTQGQAIMSMAVAVLGLGAMGSRMAARLLAAGHPVTVWNRSPDKAQPLVAQGARVAPTPAAAARDADVVIAMVRDDAASNSVWVDPHDGALIAMKPGAIAIESSTLSPDYVATLARLAEHAGVKLLDAPVSGSRAAADGGQLVFLVGGDAEVFEHASPVLKAMGSAVHHVGPIGHGMLAKLATNALLGIHVTAFAEIVGLLQRHGASAAKVLQAVSATPVWAPVDAYLSGTMLSRDFRPQFPIELIAKDFGYVLDAADGAEHAPTAAAALQVFKRAVEHGLGDLNMTGVVKLYGSN